MENVILIVLICTMNIICLFFGAYIVQKVQKNEVLKLPNVNPIAKVKKWEENRENKKQNEKLKKMMDAIDNY
jgi:uncharacterized protein YneF (UPF0154 family)